MNPQYGSWGVGLSFRLEGLGFASEFRVVGVAFEV